MTYMPQLNRRSLLVSAAAIGGGLSLGFRIPFGLAGAQAADSVPEVNAWVVIRPDDTVVIRIARSEMGQGTLTGLAQLVAEELDCDWSKVVTEFPTPGQSVARKRPWGDMSTGGSRGIRGSQEYVRKGGAAARMMLLQAAADQWKVPVAELTVANGVITHAKSNRTITYGKVASAAAKLPAPDPKDIKLKDPKDWKIIGKPLARLDTADKINGKQVFAIDVKLPGMLNAAIMDAPVFGAKVKSYDEAKAKAMPGVRHVMKVGDTAVAVVADTWWQADKALKALNIAWKEGPNDKISSETIMAFLKEGLEAKDGIFVGNKAGDAPQAIAGAAKKLEAVYYAPLQNHACMEPMNCTAKVTADKCEVWVATQAGEGSLAAAAEAAGLPLAKCEVYKMHLGGGFGRRGAFQDYVTQAVTIAKQIPGTPVKLVWNREEDMRQGRFKPVGMCKVSGGLNEKGELVGLHMRISAQSILAQALPARLEKDGKDIVVFQGLNEKGPEGQLGYTIANILVDHAMRNVHVPPGFWRGVNNNQNAIWLETFIDQLAKAAGKDPLEFRRKMMANHPKHLAVLNAVAERVGWGKPAPQGVFRGLAQQMGYGSYVAAAAEISVSDGNKIKIHRIVGATDCGYAVNPAQIDRQVSGSFVYGLSALFNGECTVKDGRIEQQNFDSYDVMRIAQ